MGCQTPKREFLGCPDTQRHPRPQWLRYWYFLLIMQHWYGGWQMNSRQNSAYTRWEATCYMTKCRKYMSCFPHQCLFILLTMSKFKLYAVCMQLHTGNNSEYTVVWKIISLICANQRDKVKINCSSYMLWLYQKCTRLRPAHIVCYDNTRFKQFLPNLSLLYIVNTAFMFIQAAGFSETLVTQ